MSVVTFLIGNGFDLACGLNSRYKDTYKGYTGSPSSSDVIKSFKDNIEEDIETWADFEMALAEYARKFEKEEDLIECIRDYKAYLIWYLKRERENFYSFLQNNADKRDALIQEMIPFLVCFFRDLTKNDRDAIWSALTNSYPPISCQFLSFNYTDIFDELEKQAFPWIENNGDNLIYSDNPVLHIHGKLGEDVVLGIDNESQLVNLKYQLSNRGRRAIIKPTAVEDYDTKRKKEALSQIQSSNVICVFGLSLEESDLTWKNAVRDWLLMNPDHHMVFFDYKLADKSCSEDIQKMDYEEDAKKERIKMLFGDTIDEDTKDRVFKQIHMPVSYTFFNAVNKKTEADQ